jgi:alpha-N-arabinofuranosidase
LHIIAVALLPVLSAAAKEHHVSAAAADGGDGSQASPFQTISMAAEVAQPGDIVTVHQGRKGT